MFGRCWMVLPLRSRPVLHLLILIAAGTAFTIPALARTEFKPMGGSGDIQNALVCPKGEYIIGFHGRVGAWIDRVGPVCARVRSSGKMGSGNTDEGAMGGGGGGRSKVSCSSGLLREIGYLLTPDQRMVQRIKFKCTDAKTRDRTESDLTFGSTARMGTSARLLIPNRCKEDEAAKGLKIHWGQHVNAVALICGKLNIPD